MLVEFSTNSFNKKLECTDSNSYEKDSEKYLSSIKLKKGEFLTMKIISYHGKCFTFTEPLKK
jgi:hypothetical protein